MSRQKQIGVLNQLAQEPPTSRVCRMASTAMQVALTVVATFMIGLYVFPLN